MSDETPTEHFAKVSYVMSTGFTSQAYIDQRTMEGVDKHTDRPVKLIWSNSLGYVEI